MLNSGSPENESEIVAEYQSKHPRIVLVETERESLYAAWTRGWKLAKGEYLINCNTDDRLAPDALAVLGRELDANPDVDLVYGDCLVTFGENETWERNSATRFYVYPDFFAPGSLLRFQFSPTPMWRRSVSDRVGYFDGNLKRAGDLEFNIRFSLNARARHVPRAVCLFNKRLDSLTYAKDESHNEDVRIFARYRTRESVLSLYGREGAPVLTSAERAAVFRDLAIRASEHFTPWGAPGPKRLIGFALECLQWAEKETPDDPLIAAHKALLLKEAGQDLRALGSQIGLLEKGKDVPEIARIVAFLRGTAWGAAAELPWPPAPLPFASEKVLMGEVSRRATRRPRDLDDRIRVLFVVHNYPTYRPAGAQLYARDLAQAVSKHAGFSVEVLHPVTDGSIPVGQFVTAADGDVVTHRLGKKWAPAGPAQFFCKDTLTAVRSFLRTHRYDVVHLHTLGDLTVAPLEVIHEFGIPVVMTAHDQWFLCEQWFQLPPGSSQACGGPGSPQKCAACLRRALSPADNRRFDDASLEKHERIRRSFMSQQWSGLREVWTPSESLALDHRRYGLPVTGVRALGMPMRAPAPARARGRLARTIGYLGQVRPTKGVHILLQAFIAVAPVDAKLLIHGGIQGGQYSDQIMGLARLHPGVRLTGQYHPDDVPNLLRDVDVLVNPSFNESYSLTVREAIQQGVPVIASNVGALPEIVRPELGGALFPAGDTTALSKILRTVFSDRTWLDEARRKFPALPTIEADARFWVERYRRHAGDADEREADALRSSPLMELAVATA